MTLCNHTVKNKYQLQVRWHSSITPIALMLGHETVSNSLERKENSWYRTGCLL